MAYIRWSDKSNWYIYHSSHSPRLQKGEQILCIHYSSPPGPGIDESIPYWKIKEVKSKDIQEMFKCTELEADQCMGCINEFIKDVNGEFYKKRRRK